MELIVVTGVSRGLGEAILKELLKFDRKIIGLSRTGVEINNKNYDHRKIDLENLDAVELFIEDLTTKYQFVDSIVFISNAGIVNPVGKVKNINCDEILKSIKINMSSPIILTAGLLKMTKNLKVVNISSGAAKRPIGGWAAYCSSKSGIKMFLEVMELDGEIELLNLDPGVMDTEMQRNVRSYKEDEFPDVLKFRSFKTEGVLNKPEAVALDIIEEMIARTFL